MKNIVHKPYVAPAADYGNEVHKALQEILKGNAELEDFSEDKQKSIKNGLDAINELKKDYPGLTVYVDPRKNKGIEYYEKIPMSKLTTYTEKRCFLF